MAALGAVPVIGDKNPLPPTRLFPSNYRLVRGRFIGPVTPHVQAYPARPVYISTLGNYLIRQIRIVYRQLWPDHGQRYPQ